jgi:hypothetical protein
MDDLFTCREPFDNLYLLTSLTADRHLAPPSHAPCLDKNCGLPFAPLNRPLREEKR